MMADGSRLGRGLAALIGDVGDEAAVLERQRSQRRVPIEFVKPNPRNPRRVFADAEPDDGLVELAVVTAEGMAQWARTAARTLTGSPEQSPFFQMTKARKVKVKLDRKVLYEMDGGARTKVKSYRLDVEPGAITICVPNQNGGGAS